MGNKTKSRTKKESQYVRKLKARKAAFGTFNITITTVQGPKTIIKVRPKADYHITEVTIEVEE